MKHSWNANWLFSNSVIFALQRHSDHHAHPARHYQVTSLAPCATPPPPPSPTCPRARIPHCSGHAKHACTGSGALRAGATCGVGAPLGRLFRLPHMSFSIPHPLTPSHPQVKLQPSLLTGLQNASCPASEVLSTFELDYRAQDFMCT